MLLFSLLPSNSKAMSLVIVNVIITMVTSAAGDVYDELVHMVVMLE